ncbi:uncharacterized mitochondrial protein AtMg00310-like [Rosa rugosa]|uniref:uncharacterized mitochondrial protein AtMg00310-like n=1 Tax=Rosa rugosa TaxID=74645 RepID=UPI002B414B00|nr:uncharacterized mitochondrial protein AtMg00310-like [Rosa rugosa]
MEGGMGFRDLNHFNLALLAKKCWRLIQEPNSLWAQVIKARYFPNCSFLEAVKGYRASWSWSSLLEARDQVIGGCNWQVINGCTINICKDKWLPPPNGSSVVTSGTPQVGDPTWVN